MFEVEFDLIKLEALKTLMEYSLNRNLNHPYPLKQVNTFSRINGEIFLV